MYDIKQRKFLPDITVGKFIEHLKLVSQNAVLNIGMDNYCYIHVESDGCVVNLENEPLDECYEDDCNEF